MCCKGAAFVNGPKFEHRCAGMLPMQLIATALAFENLYLFMPKNPEHDPALQVRACDSTCKTCSFQPDLLYAFQLRCQLLARPHLPRPM